MFASRTKKKVELKDGDTIVYVTIKKLSAKTLRKASEERQGEIGAAARNMGPEMLTLVREHQQNAGRKPAPEAAEPAPSEEAQRKAEREARYQAFGMETVLRAGIHSWTAVTEDGKPMEVNDKSIGDLDSETATLLHHEIIDLSLGPVDEAEREAERGNS